MNNIITNVKILGTTADSKSIIILDNSGKVNLWSIKQEDFSDYIYTIDIKKYKYEFMTKNNKHAIFTSIDENAVFSLDIESKQFSECVSFEESFDSLLSITSDLKIIAVKRADVVTVYETKPNKVLSLFEMENDSYIDATLSDNHKYFILAEKTVVSIFDLKLQQNIKKISNEIKADSEVGRVRFVELINDNKTLIIGGNKKLLIFDIESNIFSQMRRERVSAIRGITSSSKINNTDYLVVKLGFPPICTPNIKLTLWDINTKEFIDFFNGEVAWTSQYFITLDGKYMINFGYSYNGTKRIVDIYELPCEEAVRSYIGLTNYKRKPGANIFFEEEVKIFQKEFEAYDLFQKTSTDWYHEHKQGLYQLAQLEDNPPSGNIMVSRYEASYLPKEIEAKKINIKVVNSLFDYKAIKNDNKQWHINFADEILFNHYGSSLMAQDELQVSEHPLLANVFEMLYELGKEDSAYKPLTKDYDSNPNMPTPILIEGVERRIAIDTSPNTVNPNGLYGNNFSKAHWEDIKYATTVFKKPVKSNIIAMEAYPSATGEYTIEQINDLFMTAYTGFKAAKSSSKSKIEIHTGDWGTGAYGGNKVLTAFLQLLAATVAKVDLLVFHTLDKNSFEKTLVLYNDLLFKDTNIDLKNVFNTLVQMKYKWGESDGN